ncbi:MAG: VOC family protein [Anaerolineae bacterium]|nr:VOC family protein [Anaerolineae bacterium]
MNTTHISVISLPVTDQQRAKAFYVDKLGFTLLSESPFEQGGQTLTWIQLAPPDAKTSITLVTWFPHLKPGGSDMVLETSDLDADVAQLRAKGVEVEAPFATPWGEFAAFSDSEGNHWSLHQPA